MTDIQKCVRSRKNPTENELYCHLSIAGILRIERVYYARNPNFSEIVAHILFHVQAFVKI